MLEVIGFIAILFVGVVLCFAGVFNLYVMTLFNERFLALIALLVTLGGGWLIYWVCSTHLILNFA